MAIVQLNEYPLQFIFVIIISIKTYKYSSNFII